MTVHTITALTVPASLDDADAAEFHSMVRLGNAQAFEDAGISDHADTAEEMLPDWHEQTDRTWRGLIARIDDEIVGAAVVIRSNETGSTSASLDLMFAPRAWGSGIEQALLEHAEEETRAAGRRSLQSWTLHPTGEAERMLVPPTGWGRIAPTALSDLLERNGYVLEQVERNSILPLDRPPVLVEAKLADALAHAGDDYRIVEWTLPTPEHLRAGYADVIARMATDVPSAELDVDEEHWDEERIVRRDHRFAEAGRTVSVAAVEHIPSGRLVAFNELVIAADRNGVTHQFGTLVVKEHRGRRLGTIVKCANLLRWRSIAPDSPRISTFNAEENRPMLDINEAIGFVPASYAAAWQRRL